MLAGLYSVGGFLNLTALSATIAGGVFKIGSTGSANIMLGPTLVAGKTRVLAAAVVALWAGSAVSWGAAPAANNREIAIVGGLLRLTAAENWKSKKPESSIIEHEFAVPAAKNDSADGRVTFMSAGGSVEANIDRWYSQFAQPDGSATKDRAKVTRRETAGCTVHLVDVSGTFKEQRGPFAPAVAREKYRMLAAIIVSKERGNYFIKFYGPEQTVADGEKAFMGMLDSLRAK